MLNKLTGFINKQRLFEPQQKILLAVSGGVDSMVMLFLFEQSGFNYSVVHCNFQLRGNESGQDEQFVKEYAGRLGVRLHTKQFDTEDYAKANGISIEMAARELRYEYFDGLAESYHYDYIATAHHQDDQIETFFINLMRKTGIRGLSGIKPKAGKIIRPLLFTNRKEIMNFAVQNNIPYREDSTNRSTAFRRNFIRHNILPKFEEISPAFRENVLASMQNLKEAESVYLDTLESDRRIVCTGRGDVLVVNIPSLLNTKFPKLLLFEVLSGFRFNPAVIEEVFASLGEGSGKQFFSPSHRAVKDRRELIIEPKKKPGQGLFYIEKEDMELFEPIYITANLVDSQGFKMPRNNNIACLDFDKLEFPLIIRKWQQGEYFQPLGMQGFKKLSDFFIDEKMPIPEKENTWILYSGNKVVWIIGRRIDNRFKITKQTKTVYQLEVGG
ncbi:tRNA(Ile)-lysidine synthetase [hydrothermal vent metagenome]|uniref:tRNA(Ile)-lysidine synthetase n=1 Tax=hydrothermal vent metagenome TaxID=652676 RepID=A0A3B0TZQ7_9ZZZZ